MKGFMSIDEQVRIVERQLMCFSSSKEKTQYLAMFFDPDSNFCKQALDIVRSNIRKSAESEKKQ